MRLEHALILNRYFHGLFDARDLTELKQPLNVQEGRGADGQSYFYGSLLGRVQDAALRDKLAEYDARVMGYEARIAKARGQFAFKYFQYLGLLYTEIFLDRLTTEPVAFLAYLNAFLLRQKRAEPSLHEFTAFEPDDLRRLALFMATGSGKTLLLHVNLWQVLYYLRHGRCPEALVRRADKRREFDSILLITPNEGLSEQHLKELRLSDVDAVLLVEDRSGQQTFEPRVRIIEMSKLAEEASGEGVSVPLESVGGANLVFVDEGHKGTGSEARTWKNRQQALGKDGFILEYSATFAQAIGAAGRKAQQALRVEYGKSILMDYSYRHFYHDGYGKDFRVLNLSRARENQAYDLLVGGLLAFYQQYHLFHKNNDAYRPYNLEKPLWVFLGSSVKAIFTRDGRSRSDVAQVVAFLRKFLEEPDWAIRTIRSFLSGASGFQDAQNRTDLFKRLLGELAGRDADRLYREICQKLFHGSGGLEIWELKNAAGELALRVSTSSGSERPYFAVINIGDVSAFKKHLEENLKLDVHEDKFSGSLFGEIDRPDSSVNVLVGAKKFIEGWSSWRVSAMGLLNIGRGEGPQVIQLFGRGVRLKGRKWTLKRSSALPAPYPDGLKNLETLFIFGWNAEYLQAFRDMISAEEIQEELELWVRLLNPQPPLPIPVPRAGYRVEAETWRLEGGPLNVVVDLTPRVTSIAGEDVATGQLGRGKEIDFGERSETDVLDFDGLYADLVEYKALRGYDNLLLPRDALREALAQNHLVMTEADARNPDRLQEGASRLLRSYLDRFYSHKARQAESAQLEPQSLVLEERATTSYRVRAPTEILTQIKRLVKKRRFDADGETPLPRLHIDNSLFNPLLLDPADFRLEDVSIRPPGLGKNEREFVKDLCTFWAVHRHEEAYRQLEIYLLRNVPKVGVGFFIHSGFYPDFILWARNCNDKTIRVRFLDPHGLHHAGLAGNANRFDALRQLKAVSTLPEFVENKIKMDGFLIVATKLDQIVDRGTRDWPALEQEFPLIRQEADYQRKVLDFSQP
ncbi:MAG: DEAD/DEAH box helicase family protein [Verrucomicrobia bacterium]|nr:DEAD/DEAH box helicase family protein [Verrucomicrobiota bacterium]